MVDFIRAEEHDDVHLAGQSMPAASRPPSPGKKPASSAPTRAAAVCSTPKPAQSVDLNRARIQSELMGRGENRLLRRSRASAASPTTIIGRLADFSVSSEGVAASAMSARPALCRDWRSHSVRSAASPTRPTLRSFQSQALRMRAFHTAASRRGLAPTSRRAIGLFDAHQGRVEDVARRARRPRHTGRLRAGNRCSARRGRGRQSSRGLDLLDRSTRSPAITA